LNGLVTFDLSPPCFDKVTRSFTIAEIIILGKTWKHEKLQVSCWHTL